MENELIVQTDPKSALSEAIRNLRTNLQFSSVDEPLKKILVTSSTSGEGKSFISANLAVTFAQLGNRVLIVDADMRLGRQHEIFNVSNEMGLSNLLIDNVEYCYNNYIQKTSIKNLSILPRGVVPPNPSELLASNKCQILSDLLGMKYDMVIWDGVPLIGLTDSLIMANLVDKIVLVCAYKKTPIELIQNSKTTLKNFSNKIAGVVVNKVPSKNNRYYKNKYLKD